MLASYRLMQGVPRITIKKYRQQERRHLGSCMPSDDNYQAWPFLGKGREP